MCVGRTVIGERRLSFRSVSSQRREEGGENASEYDDWLKLGLHLSFPDETSDALEGFYPLEKPRVAVRVLTDRHIKDHTEGEASMDVFSAPGFHVYLCPPTQSLKSVVQMV